MSWQGRRYPLSAWPQGHPQAPVSALDKLTAKCMLLSCNDGTDRGLACLSIRWHTNTAKPRNDNLDLVSTARRASTPLFPAPAPRDRALLGRPAQKPPTFPSIIGSHPSRATRWILPTYRIVGPYYRSRSSALEGVPSNLSACPAVTGLECVSGFYAQLATYFASPGAPTW